MLRGAGSIYSEALRQRFGSSCYGVEQLLGSKRIAFTDEIQNGPQRSLRNRIPVNQHWFYCRAWRQSMSAFQPSLDHGECSAQRTQRRASLSSKSNCCCCMGDAMNPKRV